MVSLADEGITFLLDAKTIAQFTGRANKIKAHSFAEKSRSPHHEIGHRGLPNREKSRTSATIAGELTEVWVPDAAHEAMRDLMRARAVKN